MAAPLINLIGVATAISRKKRLLSRREENRALLLTAVAALVPCIGMALAIAASRIGPDLSDLAARRVAIDGKAVLDWPALLTGRSRGLSSDPRVFAGAMDCALGYMADADKAVDDGAAVTEFVLLPETGNLLHPEHRFGDQMIAVRLRADERVRFFHDNLTWACGSFQTGRGDPEGQRPLYLLSSADAKPADKSDIARYFTAR